MKKYRWLIFDADNTLFDFDRAQEQAFYALLEQEHITDTSGVYDLYQQINHQAWQDLEKGNLSPAEIKHIRFEQLFVQIGHNGNPHLAGAHYLQHLSACSVLLEGAEQLIRCLAKDYLMLLMTNGLKDVQRSRFNRSSLVPFFEDIIISEEIGYAKPNPEIFEIAFRNRPVDKTQILMIGDNLHSDIAGGLAWGVDTCWYNPHQRKNNHSIIPTYEVSSFLALQSLLGVGALPDTF